MENRYKKKFNESYLDTKYPFNTTGRQVVELFRIIQKLPDDKIEQFIDQELYKKHGYSSIYKFIKSLADFVRMMGIHYS